MIILNNYETVIDKLRQQKCFWFILMASNGEGAAIFFCCLLCYEGALSVVQPAEYSRISLCSRIEFWAKTELNNNLDQLFVIILSNLC